MTDKTYYEILGVGQQADGNAIHRSYWQLARKYQASAPADPRARQMLDDLNEAYGVLGTPTLREEYDAALVDSGDCSSRSAGEGAGRGAGRPGITGMLPWRRKGRTEAVRPEPQPVAARRAGRRTSVDDLRLSTASIVGRWRQNAAPDVLRVQAPDSTLVDIFESERAVEEPAEPLSAVLDVLRGSREPAKSR